MYYILCIWHLAVTQLEDHVTTAMDGHYPKNGHPPSKVTNSYQNLPVGSVVHNMYLTPRLISQIEDQVTTALNGHPPSSGKRPKCSLTLNTKSRNFYLFID